MSIIRVLSAEVAGRIAAGEVVERPASVVKELVENSIDAGATRIRIAAEQGGQRLIQITDNGCGMDRDDAIICFEAHATSKISTEADVGQIKSLGFRGEAIPSISSVSHFSLQTRRATDDVGTEIIVDNGVIRDIQDCGCAPGTSIKVAHLFGNLPARRKFLKGPDTEDGHITEMVLQLALARPDISFTLVLNGRETLRANASNDLGARLMMLLGRDTFQSMIPVQYQEDGITVRGYVSKPGFTRSSRHDQRTIVNGRVAASDTIFFAIRDAYESLIMKGRYPSTVLTITLPPDQVDVNVHPTKREVRFRSPRQVSDIIAAALRQALRQLSGGPQDLTGHYPGPAAQPFQPAPRQITLPLPPEPTVSQTRGSLPFEQSPDARGENTPEAPYSGPCLTKTPTECPDENVPLYQPAIPSFSPCPRQAPAEANQPGPKLQDIPRPKNTPAPPPAPKQEDLQELPAIPSQNKDLAALKICGKLGKRYILAESPHGLVIIDLRAAHQRILFEKLLANLKSQKALQQTLLLPITLNLGLEEARFLKTQLPHFQAIGFSIEHFGGNSYLVTAVPASYPNQDVASTIRDIIDDLRQSRTTNVQSAIHIAQAACRHAIGLKETLTEQETTQLLQLLAGATMPYADPNGNPTMIHITMAELEKRFKG